MILSEDFVSTMEERWTTRLGNTSSPALRKVWKQIAEVFGGHIAGHSDEVNARKWHVLQPPTGSGKSQGTIVYCSMLSQSRYVTPKLHPGALLVTRLIVDAEGMADQINELVGEKVALAFHSGVRDDYELEELKDWPILVVTHRAYELALDKIGPQAGIRNTWPHFHSWKDGTRQLVVIDESLDIVEHSHAGLQDLRITDAAIPQHIRREYPEQIAALGTIIELLEDMEKQGVVTPELRRDRMLKAGMWVDGSVPDMCALRHAIYDLKFEVMNGLKADPIIRRKLWSKHDQRLKDIHNILRTWAYYTVKDGSGYNSLNTARLLVPEEVKGAVVLDATAGCNVLYEVFEEATVLAPPPGSRSYQNVTLHVSRGHSTGKRAMFKEAKQRTAELVTNLEQTLSPNTKLFAVTHMDVEPYLVGHDTAFDMKVGHYGAIDGSNEYRDCDAVVIFGLPYMPNTWAPNVFMAAQGMQDDDWLRTPEARAFKSHADIRRSLYEGQMIVDVVQALNRTQMRKVIDEEGNCPVTEAWIMLSKNAGQMDRLLDGIRREMPGINIVEDWKVDAAKTVRKASKHESTLMAWMTNAEPGSWPAGTVKGILGIPKATWERLMAKLKDASSPLHAAMAASGFTYEVVGAGRAARALLRQDLPAEFLTD